MTNLQVVQADITTFDADAIQNAANGLLQHGGGVAGAIRKASPQVQAESNALLLSTGVLEPGGAIPTGAPGLPAAYIIHAITMMYPGQQCSAQVVQRCTRATLRVADTLGVEHLAMVALGTGVGGLPLEQCARSMVRAIKATEEQQLGVPDEITFVLFGDEAEQAFEQELAWRAPASA